MRKLTFAIAIIGLLFITETAYSLNNFLYKEIALNSTGQILPGTGINVQITIISSTSGELYKETHLGITTDQFGFFTVKVGTGLVANGDLSLITTTADTRIKVETNVGGGVWVLSSIKPLSDEMHNSLDDITSYAWGLEGNSGTNPTQNFIGTTDAQDLIIRTNNTERIRIKDNGFVGINNSAPESLLDVLHNSTAAEPYVQRVWTGWKNVWGVNEYLFTQVGFLRIDQNAPNVVRYYSGYFVAEVDAGNPDNINPRIVPLQGQMDHFGSGTLNEVRGVAGFVNNRTNTGTINNGYAGFYEINNYSTGTISNGHTIFIENGVQNGTMTNKTGITIEEMTAATNNTNLLIGTATIPAGNFSLYNASTRDSYFNGNVGIGTTAPARKLHVSEAMRLEPLSTAPAAPSTGDMYMDDGTNTSDGNPKLMVYDGTTWQECW